MKTLILTVGLPRSGKSTWARKQGLPIVNRDSIRLALHGQPFILEAEPVVTMIENLMIKSLLECHDTVIIDETNLRVEFIEQKKQFGAKLKFKVFDTPISVCLERAILTDKPYLIPIIESMSLDMVELFKTIGVYDER